METKVSKKSSKETLAVVDDLKSITVVSNRVNGFLDRVIKKAIYTNSGIVKYQNNLIAVMNYHELKQVIRLFYVCNDFNEAVCKHFGNYTQMSIERMRELLAEWKKSNRLSYLPSCYLKPRTYINSLKSTISSFSYSKGGYSFITDLWY